MSIFKALSTSLLLGWVSVVSAADRISLQDLLSASLLDANQTKVETQVYAASHVVPLLHYQSVAEWQNYADDLRRRLLDEVVLRGEARQWHQIPTSVEWLGTALVGPGYRIKKLRYEAIPSLWIPALLYEPEPLTGKVPVVLNVNGHEKEGKAVENKQNRCINLAKKGMLALNIEWFDMGQLSSPDNNHYRANQMDLCGTSGLALHYLALKRGIDILLSLDHADPERLAVTGLSGGGWQTIFISSLDTRVRLANPVAGYSSYLTRTQFPDLDLGDSEQTPPDFASLVDYTHLTSLIAPRPLLLTNNAKDDCCYRADYSLGPLLSAARPVYSLYKQPEKLRYHINHDPGHNYGRDNREAFYRMLKEFFFAEKQDFNSVEVVSDSELRSSEDLSVSLPTDNLTFHSVAMKLSQHLPRDADLPASTVEARRWQEQRRADLFKLVRGKTLKVRAEPAGNKEKDGVSIQYWKVKMDNGWTVPVVELRRGETKATTIVVADEGRVSTIETVGRLLAQRNRVIAVDPFYFGECRPGSKRDFLYALLLASLGSQPLGIQASQLMAVAQWLKHERGLGPVSIEALGERASLAALVSAGLDKNSINGLSLHKSLASLKEVIERNLTAQETPEFFCFGLLERLDIKQLIALVAPRPVQVVTPGDRTRKELSGVREFYSTLGTNFNPLD
ncbi:MAG: alpha/beta hydrolase family protein [Acidobacteria bacterium]|nr:alpha/beta hydrolase family protein [Acidobacteriota bacterium]MCI0720950.1 alpha/beta hydrolase family protein [Acidobacteriota bacterium]